MSEIETTLTIERSCEGDICHSPFPSYTAKMPLTPSQKQELQAKYPGAIVEFSGARKFLSNFYRSSFELDGITYSTAEHAFQAQKSTDAAQRQRIANTKTARQSKVLGRAAQNDPARTPGWFSGGRDEAMRKVLAAKVRATACAVAASACAGAVGQRAELRV